MLGFLPYLNNRSQFIIIHIPNLTRPISNWHWPAKLKADHHAIMKLDELTFNNIRESWKEIDTKLHIGYVQKQNLIFMSTLYIVYVVYILFHSEICEITVSVTWKMHVMCIKDAPGVMSHCSGDVFRHSF